MEELKNKLNSVSISSLKDSWRWKINANGTFSVQSLRMRLVDNMANGVMTDDFRWITWLPLKINCFVWRPMLNKIPLSNNLSSKGIQVTSHQCKMCLLEDENVDHVFFRCEYALSLWLWLCNWSGLMDVAPIDFVSFSTNVNSCNGDVEKKKMFLSLGYTVLWLIWKERNERFFRKRIKKAMQLADDIQLFAFNWIKNRGNIKRLDWTECFGVLVILLATHGVCFGVCLVYVSLSDVSLYGYGLPLVFFVFVSKGCVLGVLGVVSIRVFFVFVTKGCVLAVFGVVSIRVMFDLVVVPSLCSCVMLVAFGMFLILWFIYWFSSLAWGSVRAAVSVSDGVSILGISSGSPPLLGVLGAEVFLTVLPLMMYCASALAAVFVCLCSLTLLPLSGVFGAAATFRVCGTDAMGLLRTFLPLLRSRFVMSSGWIGCSCFAASSCGCKSCASLLLGFLGCCYGLMLCSGDLRLFLVSWLGLGAYGLLLGCSLLVLDGLALVCWV
ncbi:hypothetical protein LXL04_032397 [Taraxacum kok-saghyz]